MIESNKNHDWLKGTLPTWIGVGLIGILSWFVIRLVDRVERKIEQVDQNRSAIAILSVEMISIKDGFIDLKSNQKEMVDQLRQINEELRKRK